MFEGIGTLTGLNQENPQAVQSPMERLRETTTDVVKGKINPVESLDNPSDESGSSGKANSGDLVDRGSGEGRIIELLG